MIELESLVEVTLKEDEDFLKIRERELIDSISKVPDGV